jgi:3-methyladenine DNA glycosylase AlkD
MAEIAVHHKNASDETFLDFLPVIVREASDERNFVKKAVNWAMRQIWQTQCDSQRCSNQNMCGDQGF